MGRTVYQRVMVTDAAGDQHIFNRGDEVPDELVERMDNEAVFVDTNQPVPGADPFDAEVGMVPTGEPAPAGVVLDAPYAGDTPPVPFQPDSGPVSVAGGTSADLTGEAPSMEPQGDGKGGPSTGSRSPSTDGGSSEPAGEPEGGTPAGTRPSSEELDGMSRRELDQVASSLGISVPSGANKDQVRQLIDSADTPGS